MTEESRVNVELEESVIRAYAKASNIRPKNTSRAYKNKQVEFTRWCGDKGLAFNDLSRYTVTGPKLHLFLEECVIGREKRRKGEGTRTQKIGRATVNSYVAAMVDLWHIQQRLNINDYPFPRDDAVFALLKVTEYEEDDPRRKNFEDRGANTMLDGYTTTDQLGKIASFFWSARRNVGTSIKNLLAFLRSHFALMRVKSARKMELADLHSVCLENEGYSTCRALVMVMRQGQTNQVGRIEVGACMRNKHVNICPHGLLGFYLFWCWYVELESFPGFSTSDLWYPIKLLKTSKDPTKGMSYKVHRDAIAGALHHIGLQSRAKIHVGRGSGARMADLGGLNQAARKMEQSSHGKMLPNIVASRGNEDASRLRAYPRQFFSSQSFRRTTDCSTKANFPAVECWQTKFANGECEQSIAGGGFLELMLYMCVVILQDAAILFNELPSHPIRSHKIFQSREFRKFKSDLNDTLGTLVNPTEKQLERAMPVLNANWTVCTKI